MASYWKCCKYVKRFDRVILIILSTLSMLSALIVPFEARVPDLGSSPASSRYQEPEIGDVNFFVENKGQWDRNISYVGTTTFGSIALGRDGWDLDVRTDRGGCVISYLLSDKCKHPMGTDVGPGYMNYLYGKDPAEWTTGASRFGCVTYEDVWDSIDIRFTLGRYLKYDIVVPPGSDLSKVTIGLRGQNSVDTSGDEMRIAIDGGSVIEALPRAYYMDDPDRPIPARFKLLDNDVFSFDVPDLDTRRGLVIDPLVYSTFIGSTSAEAGKAVDLDGSGCPYITGTTQSSSFPTTTGSYDTTFTGGRDVFVSKFDPKGSKLIYSTFIGGTDTSAMWEEGAYLVVDSGGNATVLANTDCSDFPTTSGAYDPTHNGNSDAVVFMLNSTGKGLSYSTFIGGSGMDSGCSIDLDGDGSVYIVGDTFSSDMPTTSGAYDTSLTGSVDIFVAKLDPTGSNLKFLTYLGQDGYAAGITHDRTGVYVTGSTWTSGHPTTTGAYDRSANGGNDVFVTKFNTLGTALSYSTFVGGSTHDYSSSIEVDSNGNVYLTGTSWSNNFPTTSGAYDTTSNNIHSNGIVFKLNATGASLVFSTYLGGSGTLGERLRDLVLDLAGNVYVAGDTDSLNYPTTTGAFDTTHSGSGDDCVLSVLNNAGSILAYSTFFGGSGADYCYGIVRDRDGNVILTGQTTSSDLPISSGSYDTTQNGGGDAFVLMLNFSVKLPPAPPMNLTGSMGRGFIAISWEAPLYDGGAKVLAYSITRGNPGETGTVIDSVGPASRGYNDTTVTIGRPYWYSVGCNNSAGRSPQTEKVVVRDLNRPTISNVLGVGHAVIGKGFNVTATVKDDIILDSVQCEHWFGEGTPRSSEMMSYGKDVWGAGFIIEDTLNALHCRISASDACGNTVTSSLLNISVIGSVLPTIDEDTSDPIAYTGDPFELRVHAIDSFGIKKVCASVEGIGQKGINTTLEAEGDDHFSGYVTVPSDQVDPIQYHFSALDLNGNWNTTEWKEVPVIDDDPPQFRVDSTSSSCNTGLQHDFIVSYHDNIGVESVVLNYSWTPSFSIEKQMTYQGAGYWRTSLLVPDSALELHYHTTAFDAQGNSASSDVREVELVDAEWPEIICDLSKSTTTCGSDFIIQVEVRDNREVGSVWAEYWFGEMTHEKVRCYGPSGIFEGVIPIPFDSIDPLQYLVHVKDVVGNENVSFVRSVTVFDRTAPSISEMPNIVCLLGQRISLEVDPFDNIGVTSVIWAGGHQSVDGMAFEWTARDPGVHKFNVTAFDRSGNMGRSFFNITVLNVTADSDRDGIDDLIELDNGLDPFDASDASLDRDSDGLTNLAEVLKGTDLSNDDTDMDGMPDGWETRYGLDPLRYSSEEDADGDGDSDLREYLGSTDPTVSDREIELSDSHWDKVLAVIFLIMSAALLSGAFIMAFKRKKDGRASDPVPSGPPFPVPAEMVPPSDQSVDQPFDGQSPPDRPASVDDWLEAAIRDHDDNAFSEIEPMDPDHTEGVPDKSETVDATSIEGGAGK